MKLLRMLLIGPLKAVDRFLRFRLLPALLRAVHGVEIGSGVDVAGWPAVFKVADARIVIGDRVILCSRNRRHHVNMHSPMKLQADYPGAEIRVGENTQMFGVCLHAYERITIGKNVLIAANVQIIDGNGHDVVTDDLAARVETSYAAQPVTIEDNAWIGANSIVLPGVTIGEGSVVAAGSVVVKDIPAGMIAGGNPAKVIRPLRADEPDTARE